MVNLKMESLFPASRDELWRVLPLHVKDEVIGKIHPGILSQKFVSQSENTWIVDRKVHSYGQTVDLKMQIRMNPPESYRWEILESGGGPKAGSFVENVYTDSEGGTKVSTYVEMILQGVPSFLQGWLVRRVLTKADNDDFQYLKSLQNMK